MKHIYGVFPQKNIHFSDSVTENIQSYQTPMGNFVVGMDQAERFFESSEYLVYLDGAMNNIDELRKILNIQGQQTAQDIPRLIQELFQKEGPGAFSHLNGNFCLILFEKKSNTLYLARSKFSTGNIYYLKSGESLIFANSLRKIIHMLGERPSISPDFLLKYFAYGFVPSPNTPFNDIKKIPQAHYLEFNAQKLSLARYWNITFAENPYEKKDIETYRQEMREILFDCTKRRFDSTKSTGLFLSGGLDSSSLAGTLRALYPDIPITTFTAIFDEQSFDESQNAKKVASFCKTDHQEILFTPQKALTFIENFIQDIDEPFSDDDVICGGILSEVAQEKAQQIFLGDGPDEIFMGYPSFLGHKISNIYEKIPAFIRNLISSTIKQFPVSYKYRGFDSQFKQFTGGLGYPPQMRDAAWWGPYPHMYQRNLFNKEMDARLNFDPNHVYNEISRHLDAVKTDNLTNQILTIYLNLLGERWYLKLGAVQRKTSLQFEMPFLDENFINYANTIPSQYKQKSKYILRKTIQGLIPDEITWGPKRPFFVPLAIWMKNHFQEILRDNLSSSNLEDLGLNSEFFHQLMTAHFQGKENNAKQIWNIFIFVAWYESLKQTS